MLPAVADVSSGDSGVAKVRSKPRPGGAGGMRALEAMVANQRSAIRHWRDDLTLRPRETVVNRRVQRRVQSDSVQVVQQHRRLVRRPGAPWAECRAPQMPGPATTRHHRVFADRSRAQAWSMPAGPATGRVEATRRALTTPSTASASLARWWCARAGGRTQRTSRERVWSARASCTVPWHARSSGHGGGLESARATGASLPLGM